MSPGLRPVLWHVLRGAGTCLPATSSRLSIPPGRIILDLDFFGETYPPSAEQEGTASAWRSSAARVSASDAASVSHSGSRLKRSAQPSMQDCPDDRRHGEKQQNEQCHSFSSSHPGGSHRRTPCAFVLHVAIQHVFRSETETRNQQACW